MKGFSLRVHVGLACILSNLTGTLVVDGFSIPVVTHHRYHNVAISQSELRSEFESAAHIVRQQGRKGWVLLTASSDDDDIDDLLSDDENDDSDDEAFVAPPKAPLAGIERAWRYASKPLLRIGSKGATLTHGNSLRQLLEAHGVVKVKVNTRRFDDSLQTAFEQLRHLAEESGAPKGIECVQARDFDKIILFGEPGISERIQNGDFPPPELPKGEYIKKQKAPDDGDDDNDDDQ